MKKTFPTVSVIIPVYNAEKYLSSAVNSVLAQTFDDFEIIAVDDGSTDVSPEILKKFAKFVNCIRVIKQKNAGPAAARKTGLGAASGKYVYFMDADDLIHPQLLECAHELAGLHAADMVCFGFAPGKEPDFHKISCMKSKAVANPLDYYFKPGGINDSAACKFFSRAFLKNARFAPDGVRYCEDNIFTLSLLRKNPRTVLLDAPLYFYRPNPESITRKATTTAQVRDYMVVTDAICKMFGPRAPKNVTDAIFSTLRRLAKGIYGGTDDTASTEFAKLVKKLYARGYIRLPGLSPRKIAWFLRFKKLAT